MPVDTEPVPELPEKVEATETLKKVLADHRECAADRVAATGLRRRLSCAVDLFRRSPGKGGMALIREIRSIPASRKYRRLYRGVDVGWERDPLRYVMVGPGEGRCLSLLEVGNTGRICPGSAAAALAQRQEQMSALIRQAETLASSAPRPLVSPGRVLVVTATHPDSSNNGYNARTRALLTALKEKGLELILVSPDVPAGTELKVDGIRTLGLGPSDGFPMTDLLTTIEDWSARLASLARDEGAEVIQASSNWLMGWVAHAAAARCGLPFYYEIRGLWHLTRASVEPGFTSAPAFAAQQHFETALARASSHTFALGQPLAEHLHGAGVPMDHITVLANGVFHVADAIADQGVSPRSLCYFGTLTPYEGLDDLMEALAILKRRDQAVTLTVYGDGPERHRLAGLADRLDLAACVSFHPPIDQRGVHAEYRRHALAVIPRRDTEVTRRVTPLKPAEAMAAGVPLIVSDLPPLQEYAADGQRALVVPAEDKDALATGIEMALGAQRNEALARAERALRWIRQERTWSAVAGRVQHAYARGNDDNDAP